MSEEPQNLTAKRQLLRHGLAIIAYRGGKVLLDAPQNFGTFKVAEASRGPAHILVHICDLLEWALSLAHGEHVRRDSAPGAWNQDLARFFKGLERLDEFLASDEALGTSPGAVASRSHR